MATSNAVSSGKVVLLKSYIFIVIKVDSKTI